MMLVEVDVWDEECIKQGDPQETYISWMQKAKGEELPVQSTLPHTRLVEVHR